MGTCNPKSSDGMILLIWEAPSPRAMNDFSDSGEIQPSLRNHLPSITNSDHPSPAIFAKIYSPKICHAMGVRMTYKGRLKSRDFCRNYRIRTQKYGIRTPPLFMPYEPFLSGVARVGVVFHFLNQRDGVFIQV